VNVAWYATRAAGMVAFLGLTASVLVGLLLAGRARLPRWPRFAVEDVHLFAGALTWTFVAAHIATLLLDDYIGFSLVDVLVPGASGYVRAATAIGVLAFWLLLAIGVSNRLRRVLPYAAWRRIHLLNFPVWLLALAHGIFGGTDTGTLWATAAYAVAAAGVAGAVAWRFLRPRHVEEWALLLWPATAAVVSCELVVALALVG
jgi:sulfoxide reductase heme-binding subunit YedZ